MLDTCTGIVTVTVPVELTEPTEPIEIVGGGMSQVALNWGKVQPLRVPPVESLCRSG